MVTIIVNKIYIANITWVTVLLSFSAGSSDIAEDIEHPIKQSEHDQKRYDIWPKAKSTKEILDTPITYENRPTGVNASFIRKTKSLPSSLIISSTILNWWLIHSELFICSLIKSLNKYLDKKNAKYSPITTPVNIMGTAKKNPLT